jgi:aliphatic nitrilase
MVEQLCTDDTKRALLLPGGGYARIYAPDGQLLHEPLPEDTEGIVYADLDLGLISLAKAAADPAGHYARPDVTRLLLNKTPGDRVVPFSTPGVQLGGRASHARASASPEASAGASPETPAGISVTERAENPLEAVTI